jgi:hypothetical protein
VLVKWHQNGGFLNGGHPYGFSSLLAGQNSIAHIETFFSQISSADDLGFSAA